MRYIKLYFFTSIGKSKNASRGSCFWIIAYLPWRKWNPHTLLSLFCSLLHGCRSHVSSFFPSPLLPSGPLLLPWWSWQDQEALSSALVKVAITQSADGWFSNYLLLMNILAKVHLLSFKAVRSARIFSKFDRQMFSVVGYRYSSLQALYQPFKKWI